MTVETYDGRAVFAVPVRVAQDATPRGPTPPPAVPVRYDAVALVRDPLPCVSLTILESRGTVSRRISCRGSLRD